MNSIISMASHRKILLWAFFDAKSKFSSLKISSTHPTKFSLLYFFFNLDLFYAIFEHSSPLSYYFCVKTSQPICRLIMGRKTFYIIFFDSALVEFKILLKKVKSKKFSHRWPDGPDFPRGAAHWGEAAERLQLQPNRAQ